MPKTPADRRSPKKSIRRVTTKSLGRTSAGPTAAKSPKSAGPDTKSATPKPRPQDAKGGTTGKVKSYSEKKGCAGDRQVRQPESSQVCDTDEAAH
jgi:hypothetical protein